MFTQPQISCCVAGSAIQDTSKAVGVMNRVSSGSFQLPAKRKHGAKHAAHPASHDAYTTLVSDSDMQLCIHVGVVLAFQLLNAIGYAQLLQRHPTFQQAMVAFLKSTKPGTSNKAAALRHAWQQEACKRGTAEPISLDPQRPDAMLRQALQQPWAAQMQADCARLRAACDAIVAPSADPSLPPDADVTAADSLQACNVHAQGHGNTFYTEGGQAQVSQLVRHSCNFLTQKQSRNQLQRFSQSEQVIRAGFVKDAEQYAAGADVRVGLSVLAAFQTEGANGEDYMIGQVRQLRACDRAPAKQQAAGAVASKQRPPFFSVAPSDESATFFAQPWALIRIEPGDTMSLTVRHEAVEVFPVAGSSQRAARLPSADSDDEDADDAAHALCQQADTPILLHQVNMQWWQDGKLMPALGASEQTRVLAGIRKHQAEQQQRRRATSAHAGRKQSTGQKQGAPRKRR